MKIDGDKKTLKNNSVALKFKLRKGDMIGAFREAIELQLEKYG